MFDLLSVVPPSAAPHLYETLCTRVRDRNERHHVDVTDTLDSAADLLVAKRDYERTTHTGHGKRNPQHVAPFSVVAGEIVGKSPKWVDDHIRLPKRLEHDPEAVVALAEMTDLSFRLLLAFADAPVTSRRLALEAHRTGGANAMRKALAYVWEVDERIPPGAETLAQQAEDSAAAIVDQRKYEDDVHALFKQTKTDDGPWLRAAMSELLPRERCEDIERRADELRNAGTAVHG
jgi:hypothetical protein